MTKADVSHLTRSPVLTRARGLSLQKSRTATKYGHVITIDGHAGVGKSTVSKLVAKQLGFLPVNTGAMYRGFAFYAIKHKVNLHSPTELKKALKSFPFEAKLIEGEQHFFVKGKDVTKEIYEQAVTKKASDVAKLDAVRKKLVSWQRKAAIGTNCVFEGRDMGTVVFPRATLKIYLSATMKERAHRRFKEIKEQDPENKITEAQIKKQIAARDRNDSTRKNSPTKKALDAVEIKTSRLTIEQVQQKILDLYQERVGTKSS